MVVPPGTFDEDAPEQADRAVDPEACTVHRTRLDVNF